MLQQCCVLVAIWLVHACHWQSGKREKGHMVSYGRSAAFSHHQFVCQLPARHLTSPRSYLKSKRSQWKCRLYHVWCHQEGTIEDGKQSNKSLSFYCTCPCSFGLSNVDKKRNHKMLQFHQEQWVAFGCFHLWLPLVSLMTPSKRALCFSLANWNAILYSNKHSRLHDDSPTGWILIQATDFSTAMFSGEQIRYVSVTVQPLPATKYLTKCSAECLGLVYNSR